MKIHQFCICLPTKIYGVYVAVEKFQKLFTYASYRSFCFEWAIDSSTVFYSFSMSFSFFPFDVRLRIVLPVNHVHIVCIQLLISLQSSLSLVRSKEKKKHSILFMHLYSSVCRIWFGLFFVSLFRIDSLIPLMLLLVKYSEKSTCQTQHTSVCTYRLYISAKPYSSATHCSIVYVVLCFFASKWIQHNFAPLCLCMCSFSNSLCVIHTLCTLFD